MVGEREDNREGGRVRKGRLLVRGDGWGKDDEGRGIYEGRGNEIRMDKNNIREGQEWKRLNNWRTSRTRGRRGEKRRRGGKWSKNMEGGKWRRREERRE